MVLAVGREKGEARELWWGMENGRMGLGCLWVIAEGTDIGMAAWLLSGGSDSQVLWKVREW